MCNISAKPIVIPRNCRIAQVSSVLQVDESLKSTTTTKVALSTSLHPDGGCPPVHAMNIGATEKMIEVIPTLDLSKSTIEDDAQMKQLLQIIQEFKDVFSVDSLDFGRTSTIKHTIPLIDEHPFRLPHRRIPPLQYQAVKEQLLKMEKAEVIRRSNSPYASPMVIVHKKDGSLRVCIDYRQLNSKTVRDAYPLESKKLWMPLVTPSSSQHWI